MPLPFATFPIPAAQLVSAFRGDYNNMLTAVLSCFTGPDAPPQLFAGMLWVDTAVTPKLLKQRNTANTAWIVRGQVDIDYGGLLPLLGGTMTGPIDMGGFAITNLAQGSGNSAARVADLASYAKLGLGGDAAAAFAKVPNVSQIPSGTHDPTVDDDLARKAYVDAKAVAGGTFSGAITLPNPPTPGSAQAIRAVDVENKISAHTHDGSASQGVKIQNTSLASSPATAGDSLRADGSSGVLWARGKILNDFAGPLLFSHTTTVALTEVDLAPYLPVTSRLAILQIEFTSQHSSGNETFVQVALRRRLSSFPQVYRDRVLSATSSISVVHSAIVQVIVEVDPNLRFSYETTKSGGGSSAAISCWLAGYI